MQGEATNFSTGMLFVRAAVGILFLVSISALQPIQNTAFVQSFHVGNAKAFQLSTCRLRQIDTLRDCFRRRKVRSGIIQANAELLFPAVLAKHAAAVHHFAKPTLALWHNEVWVLTTCIILLGIAFEKLEHRVMHTTPKSFKPAISAMFNEFGALGFISVVVFLVTHPGRGPDAIFKVPPFPDRTASHFTGACRARVLIRGGQVILRKAAAAVGSSAHHLIHDFEMLHFALFFIVNVYFAKAPPQSPPFCGPRYAAGRPAPTRTKEQTRRRDSERGLGERTRREDSESASERDLGEVVRRGPDALPGRPPALSRTHRDASAALRSRARVLARAPPGERMGRVR